MEEVKTQNPVVVQASTMIECPFCKAQMDAKAYFCPNCGKKVREKPLSTGWGKQLLIYALAVLLPPFNIGLSVQYIRSPEPKAKKIGWISIVLMTLSLIAVFVSTYYFTKYISDEVNKQVTEQLKGYGSFAF